jgi:hypothetical protein
LPEAARHSSAEYAGEKIGGVSAFVRGSDERRREDEVSLFEVFVSLDDDGSCRAGK